MVNKTTLTVRQAFELAGHRAPEGAKIFAHTPIEDGDTASTVKRYWCYHFRDEFCYFLDGEWNVEWIGKNDFNSFRRVLADASINLENLPARDCLNALPGRVKDAVLRYEEEPQQ